MKKLMIAAVTVIALAAVGVAGAAVVPDVYDPGNTKCVKASFNKGWLHLEKNCPTATNAAAGAQITGVSGQTFTSAEFTLKSATQCQGGSPRFNVVTTTGLFFLGCNNVTPTINADGTATYLFNAATLAAAGQQVPTPTGTITSVSIILDVQGMADLKNIKVNGELQKPAPGKNGDVAAACKKGGWKTIPGTSYKNQGQCVKAMVHARKAVRG